MIRFTIKTRSLGSASLNIQPIEKNQMKAGNLILIRPTKTSTLPVNKDIRLPP